jgi:hypothetical protein
MCMCQMRLYDSENMKLRSVSVIVNSICNIRIRFKCGYRPEHWLKLNINHYISSSDIHEQENIHELNYVDHEMQGMLICYILKFD